MAVPRSHLGRSPFDPARGLQDMDRWAAGDPGIFLHFPPARLAPMVAEAFPGLTLFVGASHFTSLSAASAAWLTPLRPGCRIGWTSAPRSSRRSCHATPSPKCLSPQSGCGICSPSVNPSPGVYLPWQQQHWVKNQEPGEASLPVRAVAPRRCAHIPLPPSRERGRGVRRAWACDRSLGLNRSHRPPTYAERGGANRGCRA